MIPNNKRPRDNETNNQTNKKSKGGNDLQENERLRQEIEYQRQVNEQQRQKIEQQRRKIEQQRRKIKLFRHHSKCNRLGDCAKCTQVNCMFGRHSDSLPCTHCGEDFSRGKSTKQSTIDFLRDFPQPKVLDRNEANQWIKDVPKELWLGEIMPYFSVKELSLGGTIAKHFKKYWVTFKSNREWCVPKDFPSFSFAIHVGRILSERGIISSTNENLLKIMVSNGLYDEGGECVNIDYPVSIVGESRDGCQIIGGLEMRGFAEDRVYVQNLTLCDSNENGIGACGSQTASFHLDNVSVKNSGTCGVCVFRNKHSTMRNCNVSHSVDSGLYVGDEGLITISGNGTTIHQNNTCGVEGNYYGMDVQTTSSSIHLVSPLTLETISTNNDGGRNHGGNGTIKSVDKDGKVLEVYHGMEENEDEVDE